MNICSEFPEAIIEHTDMPIVLPDGCRLSARVWIPANAEQQPVPAILEYLPYRKRDGTAARDAQTHPYLAGYGYACIRVDMRGCGDSEGLFEDEYSEQELQDGVAIIHWLAEQSWCDGKVGMMGISWGGFNGLQIAAHQPEPLKAIITLCSTTDRYADDIHYKGGVQLIENIGWAATSMSWFSTPPDPAIVGEKWREMWLERLENTPFLSQTWTQHTNRDAYWKHGSVCEDYSAIKAAVLSVGGWHDGYRNTPAHLSSNLSSPAKSIVGPWIHKYPHVSSVGPTIGFLQEALRWWDHWLKGIDNGAENDPAYRTYLMNSVKPEVSLTHRPGHWITEQQWPSDNISTETLFLADIVLADSPAPFQRIQPTTLACGLNSGEYFPFGFGPGELPGDQQEDDTISTCFDSETLIEPRDIVGAPTVKLRLASDQPKAQVVVRLCDLRPDGSSGLISFALLNLRQRDDREFPTDLKVGEFYDISLTLDQIAYRLPAGHKLRLAISNNYWPFAWPEAKAFNLTIEAGSLELPIRTINAGSDSDECTFPEAEAAPPVPTEILQSGEESKTTSVNPDTGDIDVLITGNMGLTKDSITGLITGSKVCENWKINQNDPASATADIIWERSLGRDDWQVKTKVDSRMWTDHQYFYMEHQLTAWEGDKVVFDKTFNGKAKR